MVITFHSYPKHQEQNSLVEIKLVYTMLSHSRLNNDFFYYAAKYSQRVHYTIPIKGLYSENGLPTTPYFMLSWSNPNVKNLKVFGYPTVLKNMIWVKMAKEVKANTFNKGLEVFLFVILMSLLADHLIFLILKEPLSQ